MPKIFVIILALILVPFPAMGQTEPDANQREKELKEWVTKAKEWKKWAEVWYNDAMNGIWRVKRKQRPEPPAWLSDHCFTMTRDDVNSEIYLEACKLIDDIRRITEGHPIVQQIIFDQARRENDKSRSSFWERIHLDTMHTVTQTGKGRPFAVIGMHLTIADVGRVQFYLPPGFLVVRQPDGSWKPAYTWGISIELDDFQLPGSKQRALVHLNLTKVWTHGGTNLEYGVRSGLDMVGLSFSWKANK